MSKLLYADLTNERLRRTLGGGEFSFGRIHQRGDQYIGLRFTEQVGGRHTVVEPTVLEVRVTLGEVDAQPEAGAFSLKVGNGAASVGTNETASLAYNCSASDIQTALNALTIVGTTYGAATVTEDDDSFLVIFDGESSAVPLAARANSLRPISFVRVSTYQVDGEWVHAVRLQKAPLAFTDSSTQKVPTGPSIERVQSGTASPPVNEVQKLTVPLEFLGSYQLRSNSGTQRSALLGVADGPEEIAAAINPFVNPRDESINNGLASDEDGVFVVTEHPTEPAALIEFSGSMESTAQDLLTVSVFDAPAGDYWLTLDTDTAAMAEAFRTAGETEIRVPLIIEVDIEDEDDDSITRTFVVCRQTVTVVESNTYDDLGTAANIDYLNPPAPKQYPPFSASQVTTGQRHYSTAAGDNSNTTFTIAHNLTSEEIDVRVRENSSGGALLVHGTDYSVSITDDDNLDVTLLGSYASPVPTTDSLIITVADLTATSSFDAHTHTIAEVTNLQATLDALSARVTTLEGLLGSGTPTSSTAAATKKISRWNFARLFEAYPAVETYATPESGRLADAIADIRGSDYLAFRLLNAQHDASAANLSTILSGGALPAASNHDGAVFYHDGASAITLAFGGGRGVQYLQPSEYVASDGTVWYRVTPYERGSASTFTANASTDTLTASDHQLADGARVRLTTTGTLPAGLSTGTDYYVIERTGDTFQLAATEGGSAIDVTDTGSGTHTVTPQDETSWYPTDFERELFAFGVNANQLVRRGKLSLNAGLELAVMPPPVRARQRSTRVHASLVIEYGRFPQATSPATTGLNLSDVTWDPYPALEQRVVIGELPEVHTFGLEVLRSSADALTANALYYGNGAATHAPYEFPFAVRGRIVRFDVEDDVSDPRGVLLLSGLARYEGEEAPVAPLGYAVVG